MTTTRRTKRNAPDVTIYCECGAVWVGWAAIDNPVIACHYAREQESRWLGCRVWAGDADKSQEALVNNLQYCRAAQSPSQETV